MPNTSLVTKRVVLTGGGTAGHVMPHLALLAKMRAESWDILYVGSAGVEQTLAKNAGIPFQTIQTGKLRRYFSWQNFTDIFRIGVGCLQSFWYLLRFRPHLVFAKGGFVSVPVALAAWVLRIPVVIHESDLSPGLANRIIAPFAKKILYSFPDSARFLSKEKSIHTGSPIRPELFSGNRERGLRFCGFAAEENIQTLLVMGGSLGATTINTALLQALPILTKQYRIIHLCGPGKMLSVENPRYKAFEFVGTELKDILALADLVISRAGANSIFELLALKKPMLLIPFIQGSRGDQVDNAKVFAKHDWALVLEEKDLSTESLIANVIKLAGLASHISSAQSQSSQSATESVFKALQESF